MIYNFDEVIDRRGTYSTKWDGGPLFKSMEITGRADGDTLPLFIADMDFECPPSVREEILKAADHNIYGYTALHPAMEGSYFTAVSQWLKRRHNWDAAPEEMVYTDGTVNAIRHALLAFSKPGDGVLINRPIYAPFTKTILSTGRLAVNSPLINNNGYYSIDFEDFERKAALPGTTCFILCNPHNPTGRIWSDEDLIRMYSICEKNDVIVIADEIHGDLIRRDSVFHPLGTLVDARNLIACTSAGKTFNLAGLKAAAVVIKNPLLRRKYFEQTGLISTSPFTAAAVIGAYNGGETWLEQLKTYLDASFDWTLSFIRQYLPKVTCVRSEGTYILWMDFRGYGLSPEEIRKKIYIDANVILESGSMFDPENGGGFERICLSTRLKLIQEAFRRIAAEFQDL